MPSLVFCASAIETVAVGCRSCCGSHKAQTAKAVGQRTTGGLLPLPAVQVQTNVMEYRGVRYAIRIGIDKGHWQLAVFLPDSELRAEKPVIGTRQDAESAAHAIIDAWLKRRVRELRALGNSH
jgi:hypothetical protein